MTTNQLVAAILDGEHDASLAELERAVTRRKKQMFRPGTRVRVEGSKVAGEGTVLKVNPKRISVQMDDGRDWLIPPSMLEVIS